ncbi:hypothetical protein B0H66DRAFT_631499 [Apodospora peruviana]|uniref:Uncharacterized protein n=1 Tax=Apodospora peruviana TaxID=516989 RepID=A0AAE0HU37_9PEZI|nr:hypothetical protein B0H66DRAFT_631499 [Apodospora peruviana]
MCIQHNIHRMYCDVRPFIGVINLPCDCANSYPWGQEGPGENLTQCRHFRVYHEYVHNLATLQDTSNAYYTQQDLAVQNRSRWEEVPYLDGWVTMQLESEDQDDHQPNFFCESHELCGHREGLLDKAKKLYTEFEKVQACQRIIDHRGEAISRDELLEITGAIEKAWKDVFRQMKGILNHDLIRANWMFGDGPYSEDWQHDTGGWGVVARGSSSAINSIRLEKRTD